uniref:Uncharacterized protein n=1 Tax=Knipowitschia caucasica TaxID=637954 RepID=A0AAV2MLK2_KNICA
MGWLSLLRQGWDRARFERGKTRSYGACSPLVLALLLGRGVPVCPTVYRADGVQLQELSLTLAGDGIRMFRGHPAPFWHSADKSAASPGVACSVCSGHCEAMRISAKRKHG